MAKAVALEKGHDGVQIRGEGEVFEVADDAFDKDGKPADGSTWYERADHAKAPSILKRDQRPPGAGPAPAKDRRD